MKLYFRILKYIKPYRALVVLSLLSSIIFVAMNSLSVWMIGSLISTIINPADSILIPNPETINGTLKRFTQHLIGFGTKTEQLQTLCLLMIAIFTIKNILIWEKNNTSMGDLKGDYAPKYEMILFATKGRRLLNGGRDPNIVKFARTGNKLHPTQKPVELISYLVNKSSKENDIVYDPFMGSGTTAEAAYDSNRNYIGSEIDEIYYEISLTRVDRLERQGKLVV